MRGSLRQRGKNTWELRVGAGKDPASPNSAKPRYLTVYRTVRGTKSHATTALAELIAEVHGEEQKRPAAKGTVAHLLKRWLANAELSPTTRREYQRLVDRRIVPALGDMLIGKVTAEHLDALYRQLEDDKLGAGSVRQVHSILRKAFGQAVQWQWLPRNPASDARPPRARRHTLTPPSAGQVRALVAHVAREDPAFAVLLIVAASTGMRRGELCGLRWRDVSGSTLRISRTVVQVGDRTEEKDTKTHAERRVSLDPTTAAALKAHHTAMEKVAAEAGTVLAPDAFVWSTAPDGTESLEPHRVTSGFRARAKEVGVTCRLHDLRHFAATELLAAGVDVRTVAGRLGHANASTTLNVYAHWVPAADEHAAKVLGQLVSPSGPQPTL